MYYSLLLNVTILFLRVYSEKVICTSDFQWCNWKAVGLNLLRAGSLLRTLLQFEVSS